MIRRSFLALPAIAALAVVPAHAEQPYPKVDFAGDWVLEDGTGNQVQAKMRYSASLKKMRIDMSQMGMEMSSVRAMPEGDMIMWSNQMPGMAMRLPSIRDEDFDAQNTGTSRSIDGQTCTVWLVQTAEACLTDDNIPLEVSGEGHSSRLTNIERVKQDPAHFEVPGNLTVMDMPANLPGMGNMNPGGGLPF